jgi:hypothetical protein
MKNNDLRDFFAGMALSGEMRSSVEKYWLERECDACVKRCYLFADAMLKYRKQNLSEQPCDNSQKKREKKKPHNILPSDPVNNPAHFTVLPFRCCIDNTVLEFNINNGTIIRRLEDPEDTNTNLNIFPLKSMEMIIKINKKKRFIAQVEIGKYSPGVK